jgi:acyl-CoA oxidase
MHQRRLLPLLATTYALHFAQEVLVAALHQAFTGEVTEREHRELETNAAGLKAYSSWHASMTIQTCREACGGAGYLAENRFAGLKADQDVFTTFEGDNTVLLQLVAKSLLTDFRDHFGELDSIGVARFVARQFFDTVVDRTRARAILETVVDIVPTRDDDEILDRERMLELMVWREDHVLGSLARRLKAGVDDGHDAFDVFNFTQDHVITAARAHVDRIVADDFAKAIDRAPEPTRAVLGDLCDLHLLTTLERERGWYLEHGRISTDRSKAITREINRLCDELRPHAAALVDGFAIPDAVLAAPVGLRDA